MSIGREANEYADRLAQRGKKESPALRWSRQLAEARADGALSAYTTTLDWLRRYPAAEVDRRLVEMIAAKLAAREKRR